MGWTTEIESATFWATIKRSNQLSYAHMVLPAGLEPAPLAWKASVLAILTMATYWYCWWESNPHKIALTSPSSWRVYRFRHGSIFIQLFQSINWYRSNGESPVAIFSYPPSIIIQRVCFLRSGLLLIRYNLPDLVLHVTPAPYSEAGILLIILATLLFALFVDSWDIDTPTYVN